MRIIFAKNGKPPFRREEPRCVQWLYFGVGKEEVVFNEFKSSTD